MLQLFLTDLIDKFKVKNPTVFAILFTVLLAINSVMILLLSQEVCQVVDGVQSCGSLITGSARVIIHAIGGSTTVILGLLGTHTPGSKSAES